MWPPLPKEHGAWAQATLVTGAALWVAPVHTVGLWAWTITFWMVFLAHESMLVLLGQRSVKVKTKNYSRAVGWLLILMVGAAAMALWGWRGASVPTRWAVLVPGSVGTAMIPFILRGSEKSTGGEVLAALSLGGVAMPLAMRGSTEWVTALQLAAGLAGAFVLATLLVRRLLAEIRKRPEPLGTLSAALMMGMGLGMSLVLLVEGRVAEGLACLPLPLIGLRLFARPWPPHQLKRLGWMLALGNFATAGLLVVALR